MNKGKLYLIPNVIADGTQNEVIPLHILNVLPSIKNFLAEDIRTARRYLSSLKIYASIEAINFQVLNKETKREELNDLLDPILQGMDMGIISESGCPGVADPGALAAQFAHESEIQVIPLVGPSAILLALMASGLNGQQFAFHGYLPIEAKECTKAIHELEKESRQKKQTQVFIETPYRNNQLKELLLKNLKDETRLCIAINITGEQEAIRTFPVKKWRTLSTNLPKAPAIFLFLSI